MFENNPHHYPFNSKRTTVYAKNGMVATSQPLAAQAGLDMLKQGGNAVDAAIATAACLTVVEPTSNGIGGDAFALVWIKNTLYGLNASGPTPKSISIEKVKALKHDVMPRFGFIPVTVPGAPAAWAELSKRFGKLPLEMVLNPAINYAENGYPVSPTLAESWNSAYLVYKQVLNDAIYQSWFETFAPLSRAPRAGEIWSSPHHAETLRQIAKTKGEAFYRGEIADKIDDFSVKNNGFIRKTDLENYKPEWVDPISVSYRGYDVWEIPPNGQGLIALQALSIMNHFKPTQYDNVTALHQQIEAIKLAFADGQSYITDANYMRFKTNDLLDATYTKIRSQAITASASNPVKGNPLKGGTVYLATADQEGNMVSFIQSNYMGFGSGLVVPNTGIALQNRGHNFSLDKNHDNALAPNKKTFHTIIPGFLTKNNEAIGPFGVMGGFMQPQGHLQVLINSIDYGMNPQAALDAPRWQWHEGKKLTVEQSMPNHIVKALANKGHQIQVAYHFGSFGRGQIIWRNSKTGTLVGGTESRTDGSIACW